jgi:O-antigen/teichoic acid export membrane protein
LSFYLLEDRLGAAAVGIYGVAVSLAEALWIISRSISLVQMSEIANSDDLSHQNKLTAQWSRANFWLTALALIPLVMLPDPWLTWVFGRQFEGISKVILFLAPGILALSASNMLTHHFAGRGLYRLNAAVSGVTLLSLVLGLGPLLDLWGLQGASLAQSAAYMVGWLFAALVFAKGQLSQLLILLPRRDDLSWFVLKAKELIRK